ncbi:hypothetical protein ACE6H2_021684 [Prunus campanulata]
MAYLTDAWKLNLKHAAAIVNLFWGMVAIMPVGLQFVVDTFIGYYWVVLLSSFSYIAGLGFLSMLTPPDLAAATATCSAYDPECISQGQKILFFTALALIAVGFSGHLVSVPQFMAEQDSHSNRRDSSLRHLVIIPIAGAFASYYIKPWSMSFFSSEALKGLQKVALVRS